MGVVATLKSKKLAFNKVFTVLNDSTIERLVEHIEELSKGDIIRTQWHHEIGSRASLDFYMGLEWDYGIQHLPLTPRIPRVIKECKIQPYGLYVDFDEGLPSFLTLQGDSKALGMYLDTTYYRLRKVDGAKALMIAELSVIKQATDFERGRYHLQKELWKQA